MNFDMSKNIVLMLGIEEDKIVNKLTRGFAKGFEELGYNTQCVNTYDLYQADNFSKVMQEAGLVVSIAGLNLDPRAEGNLFNVFQVPVLTMMVDHPLIYLEKVRIPLKNNVISCLSHRDAVYCQSDLMATKKSFQLGHSSEHFEGVDWEEKDIDFFFCSSLKHDPEAQRKNWKNHGVEIEKFLNAILETFNANPALDLMQATKQVLRGVVKINVPEAIRPFYEAVDRYIRDKSRVDAVLKFAHIENFTLAGPGWEAVLPADHKINYIGEIPTETMRQLSFRCKMSLNAIGSYHETHERVFATMADRAVVVSNQTPFYAQHFSDDQGVFFDWSDDGVQERVSELIAAPKKLKEIAYNGHEAFLQAHTWKHRAEKVMAEMFGR